MPTLNDVEAALGPRGKSDIVAIRPVLYLHHPFVRSAIKAAKDRAKVAETGVDSLNDLERFAVMVLMNAAGLD